MAKRKKTRQQKIMADQRREASTTSLYSFSSETLIQQAKQPSTLVKNMTTALSSSYQYLASDLRKTAIFTGSIIIFELILKYFIK